MHFFKSNWYCSPFYNKFSSKVHPLNRVIRPGIKGLKRKIYRFRKYVAIYQPFAAHIETRDSCYNNANTGQAIV